MAMAGGRGADVRPSDRSDGPVAPPKVTWLVGSILAGAVLVPFLVALLVLADGWQPTGDVATIGLRSRDAWTSDAPLVGQPTTGDNYADAASNHPGPIEYWLVGPFTRLLGPRVGLIVAVAVINAAALVATVWLAWRRGGSFLLALLAVGLASLLWSLGAASLVDPMNSEVAVYAMVLTVLAAWAVLEGDSASLPILVIAASVTAQVHVSGVAFVAVPVGAAALVLIRRRGRPFSYRILAISGALAVVCWLPVALQELAGPSNLAALWTTLTTEHARVGLAFSLERLVGAVAPIPLFAHRTGPIQFAEDVAAPLVFVGAVVLGGWAAIIWRGEVLSRPRRSARLAVLIGLTLLVNVLVSAGNPPLAAYRADGARWLWAGSLLVWVSLGWSSVLRSPRAWRPAIRAWFLPVGAVVAVGVLGAAMVQPHPAGRRDRAAMRATRSLSDQVQANVEPGTYRVVLDGPLASFTIGPGVVLLLESEGYETVFDRSALTAGFGDRSGSEDPVDGTLTIRAGSSGGSGSGQEVARVEIGDGSTATSVTVERS